MPVGWLNKIHTSSKARGDFHNTRIAIHGYSQATAFKKPKATKKVEEKDAISAICLDIICPKN